MLMINIVDYRDSCVSTDEEEDDALCQPLSLNQLKENSNEDSESEFNRILEVCRKHREYSAARLEEFQSKRRPPNNRDKVFDSEYYSLPAIEQLNIQMKDESEFKRFGVVESHINFLAKIKPDKDAPHLGYETILFDHNKKPVGEIFEIFGTVTDTLYALRFNDALEAVAKLPVGEVIYYANADDAVTKAVFPNELAKLKNWERSRLPDGSSSSEELFSDDEEEKRYLARKRQKTREGRTPSAELETNNSDGIPKKRSRVGGNRLGRARNVIRPAYPRPPYSNSCTTFTHNNYMPMYPQFPSNYHQPAAVPLSYHWTVPPPPPPQFYPSNGASFTPPYFSYSRSPFPNLNHQFFNQQGYVSQGAHFSVQQNETQK